jgi:hypothetical protein
MLCIGDLVAPVTVTGARCAKGGVERKECLAVDTVDEPSPAGAIPRPAEPPESLLDGIPRQRTAVRADVRTAPRFAVRTAVEPAPGARPAHRSRPLRRILRTLTLPLGPIPTGTPFTFAYATLLLITSVIGQVADPALVHALHQGSSTDVAHLVRDPLPVLLASALWIAGGVLSPYALVFLVVLTALERRIGGWRTAGVFLLGHVLATLATEVPIGLAVLAGQLPPTSFHRLDYGISFGVAACLGAVAGLLPGWVRLPVLGAFGGGLGADLVAYTDPMTNWGHLLALAIGIALWPAVRRWRDQWCDRRPRPPRTR